MVVDLKNADVRVTHDLHEIVQLFEVARLNEATVNLWYFIDSERKVHFGKLQETTEDKTLIEIIEEDDNPVLINKDTDVFFRIDFQNMIFKKTNVVYKDHLINIKTPTSIRLIERRKVPRYLYLYNDHKEFSFKKDMVDPDEKQKTYFAKLINISEEGAALVLPERSFEEYFGEIDYEHEPGEVISGTRLRVHSITDQKLPENFFASAVYFKEYGEETEGEKEIRVGVRFEERIPHLEYHSINETNRQKLEREKRQSQEIKKILSELNIQGYHGMTVAEQETLFKKLVKDEDKHVEELRNNIESLEQLEYLTSSMKVQLFRDNSPSTLAVALRLCRKFVIITIIKDISETMREEFIYEMQKKQPLAKVRDAQKLLIKYISEREKAGDIYLDPESFKKEV